MYIKITKKEAAQVAVQIKIAQLYANHYAARYGKNEADKLLSLLRNEGLTATADHAAFLLYGALTLEELLTLPDGPVPLSFAMRNKVKRMIGAEKNDIRFDRQQKAHVKEEGKALGINYKTSQMVVYSFRPGWQLALLEAPDSFRVDAWVKAFPLEIWGMYSGKKMMDNQFEPIRTGDMYDDQAMCK